MMRNLFYFLSVFLLWSMALHAQTSEHEPHFSFRDLDTQHLHICEDSLGENTFSNALRKGFFSIKTRSFLMFTDNQEGLHDYYALAVGAGMHYQSKHWKGFHVGIGGFFKFNVFSNDLGKYHESSGSASRYEVALFDVQNPNNHHDLDRLEELYIGYDHKNIAIEVGRFTLNMPYINPQDGRMRPTIEEGVHLEWQPHSKIALQSAWLWAVSPRSTVEFFSVGHSLGVYSQGIRTDDTTANYFEHQHTKGIFLADLIYTPIPTLNFRLHHQFVENIFATSMLSAEYANLDSDKFSPIMGLQCHLQQKIGQGGNSNPDLAYYENQQHAKAWSVRVGIANTKHWLTANYTRIQDNGRFLLPREWGREPFFTFMPRERTEGMGDVNAFSLQYRSFWIHHRLSFAASYGYFDTPLTSNYRLNKYQLPSFHQVNVDIRYKFHQFLEGLEMQFLVVRKQAAYALSNESSIFNKVNLMNYNFVVNYHFGK